MEFLIKIFSGIVDSFKLKNPIVFGVVQVAFIVLYFLINTLLNTTVSVDANGVDIFLIAQENIRVILEYIQSILVPLMAIIGAHTPANFTVSTSTYVKATDVA